MKATITQISRILGLNLVFTLFFFLQINAQGSPDAPLSSSSTSGETHATSKIYSNGYSSDTTELKFTNMDGAGTGTEFVMRSINEDGLVISSNSDLPVNTTENILTLEPDGDILIENLSGFEAQTISADDDGRLSAVHSNFTTRTNLNTGSVNVTPSTWTPVGPSFTFVKEFDNTLVQAEYIGLVGYTTSSAFGVAVRVQIVGYTSHRYAEGAVTNSSPRESTYSKSIFKNIPAGTYTAQVHARSNNGNATNVNIGPLGLGGTIWIEERL